MISGNGLKLKIKIVNWKNLFVQLSNVTLVGDWVLWSSLCHIRSIAQVTEQRH